MNKLLAYAELEEVLGPQYFSASIEACFREHGYDGSMDQPHNMRVFMNRIRREGMSEAREASGATAEAEAL